MNTYGLFSINTTSFNKIIDDTIEYSENQRNIIVTVFKIHNLVLNILGYIPGLCLISGSVRMATGLIICAVTLLFGNPKEFESGLIIGHWYWEALATGCTQMARGAIEAFVQYGWVVNLHLDILATFINHQQISEATKNNLKATNESLPYSDPSYPCPWQFLKII